MAIWDATTGQKTTIIAKSVGSLSAAFDTMGARIATADIDGVRIWDVLTGSMILKLPEAPQKFHSVAFTGDETLLAAAEDGAIYTWNVADYQGIVTAVAIERLRNTRILSPVEREQFSFTLSQDARDEIPTKKPARSTDCDLLAANPVDPARIPGTGVAFSEIVVQKALRACFDAVGSKPGEARFRYQLARVMSAATLDEEAIIEFRVAAKLAYPMAHQSIAIAYREGRGVTRNEGQAISHYRRAIELGVPGSASSLAKLFWYGSGSIAQNKGEAVRVWTEGAPLGCVDCHLSLAWIAKHGLNGSMQDLEAAIVHYGIAAKLYEKEGRLDDALEASLLRTRLTYALPPRIVARLWPKIRDWAPVKNLGGGEKD